jgi:hypothetical protein
VQIFIVHVVKYISLKYKNRWQYPIHFTKRIVIFRAPNIFTKVCCVSFLFFSKEKNTGKSNLKNGKLATRKRSYLYPKEYFHFLVIFREKYEWYQSTSKFNFLGIFLDKCVGNQSTSNNMASLNFLLFSLCSLQVWFGSGGNRAYATTKRRSFYSFLCVIEIHTVIL